MLSGTATVLIWHNLVKPLGGIFAIYELLPAFIVSLLPFIVVVSLLTPAPSAEVLHEFDHYLDDPDDRHVDDDLSRRNRRREKRSRSESPRGGCCTSCNAEGRPLVPCRLFMADSDNREMPGGLFVAPDSGNPVYVHWNSDGHTRGFRFPCHK